MSQPIIAGLIICTMHPNNWTKRRFVARNFSKTDVSLFKECSQLAKMATATSVNGLWALRCDKWQFFQVPSQVSRYVMNNPTSLPLLILYPYAWWRHQMETFSAVVAICAGNSPVPGELPTQRPVTRSFDVFFHLRLNKRLSKQSWGWWFDTPSRPLWRHCNGISLAL